MDGARRGTEKRWKREREREGGAEGEHRGEGREGSIGVEVLKRMQEKRGGVV